MRDLHITRNCTVDLDADLEAGCGIVFDLPRWLTFKLTSTLKILERLLLAKVS